MELLDECRWLSLQTSLKRSSSTSLEKLKFLKGQAQEGVQIITSVGYLLERSLPRLHGAHNHISLSHDCREKTSSIVSKNNIILFVVTNEK